MTGGAAGIGLYMAVALAEAGVNLVLAARKKDRCAAVAAEFAAKYNIQTEAVGCDVTKPEDCQNLSDTAMKRLGRIDILINNSGATWGDDVLKYPLEGWRKVIDTNLTGIFVLSQIVAREMKETSGGKILNVSSTAGVRVPRTQSTPAYTASKAAVIHLTKDLAVNLAKYNIYVNTIAPGYFPSHMTAGTLDKVQAEVEAANPFSRIGQARDLKGPVLFFCSKASDYVTGQCIVIDGGGSL